MKTKTLSIQAFILAVVALNFYLHADAADYRDASFQNAYQEYRLVSDNQGGSAKKVTGQWKEIYSSDEQDPLALVYLGSSHTLMGRDALMPWSKMRYTETGLDEMALALRLLKPEHDTTLFNAMPVSVHVKTTAAITFTQVPSFFGRQEEGYYLFEDILSDPVFLALPNPAQTFAYYFAISAANQLDKSAQANDWQAKLAALNAGDDFSNAALALE